MSFSTIFGKAIQDREFEISGHLAPPPEDLLNAVVHLRAQHQARGHRIPGIIANMLDENPRLGTECSRPAPELDKLYTADYSHSLHSRCDSQSPVDSLPEGTDYHQSAIFRKRRSNGTPRTCRFSKLGDEECNCEGCTNCEV